MKIVYFLITIIYVTNTNLIDGMMVFDEEKHLERLVQKSLRYQHHQNNYEKEFRNRYHTKRTKNKKSVGIPTFQ